MPTTGPPIELGARIPTGIGPPGTGQAVEPERVESAGDQLLERRPGRSSFNP